MHTLDDDTCTQHGFCQDRTGRKSASDGQGISPQTSLNFDPANDFFSQIPRTQELVMARYGTLLRTNSSCSFPGQLYSSRRRRMGCECAEV